MIKAQNLTFSYEDTDDNIVLKNISFQIQRGTINAIIGLSGCGKSTLCQILSGIIPNSIDGHVSGDVLLDGQDLSTMSLKDISTKVGYVMQDPDRQLVTTTVEDELAFAPENLEVPPETIRQTVDNTLSYLGISHLALKNPFKLSGGQKQIVAIGSILTLDPNIIILDEPTSNLDKNGKKLVKDIILKLKEQGKTIIMVEHDYTVADYADKWIALKDGVISQHDTPQNILKGGVDI